LRATVLLLSWVTCNLRFLIPGLALLLGGVPSVLAVWPQPQQIRNSAERYSLSARAFLFKHADVSAVRSGCDVLDQAFTRYFTLIFPESGGGGTGDTGADPFTVEVNVAEGPCDGYPAEGSIENCKSENHVHCCVYMHSWNLILNISGLESLSQLVEQDDYGAYYINKTEIEDFPRFQFRGLLLDTSRHYLPLQAILKTLDAMAYSKLNVFHWHIVDDPSFPYQSRKYPDLSKKGAYHPFTHIYTQTDVRRVIEHARLRGIRVLAEFDSPGHTQSWGNGQPSLLTPCYRGDVPSGTYGPVNPILDSTYVFMANLLKEVTSVFPDSYIHLGGDEVDFSCWKSNPDIKAFMKKMGFGSDFTKLESFYMQNIVNISTMLNRSSVVWQDVFDYHEIIPKDTVLEIWKGLPEEYQKELSRITKAGHRVLLSAPWYINHISYGQDWRNSYTVQPQNFSGTEEQKKLVIGGEVCMWGEYVDATNLSPRLWPRACAAAERLWSDEVQTSSVDQAFPRLTDFRCRLLRRGIQAEPLYVGHCKNEYQGI
uniref:Beta-hexosaminidase n=1 Tax=Denticeps clupeoides TaxID=299321 RepID=A0AAY4DFV9_9TELE